MLSRRQIDKFKVIFDIYNRIMAKCILHCYQLQKENLSQNMKHYAHFICVYA